jgi:signal transduction histidine kinase
MVINDAELTPDDVVALNRLVTIARVLAGTAHDINNALQVIGGSAELLEAQAETSEPARRAFVRIRGQSARAAAAVDDVLRFARDRSDQAAVLALRDTVAQAAAMRLFLVRRAGVVLEFDAGQSPAARVRGRVGQLEQLVLNLIINAEQALAGQCDGTIALSLAEESGDAVLRVCDNGPGLAEGLGDRAFDPFVSTRARADGPGLGLAAARIIARAHLGDLTMETRAPGCCATLRLPLAP